MTEGVIWKNMLRFFFPILLGTFFQQLYNTADAIIVGNFVGEEALAAVGGASGQLINLLVGFFVGMAGGATVIIAQFFGAGDREGVSLTVHTGIAFGLVGGLVLTVVGIALSHQALLWMGTPEDVLPLSRTYMRIYFAGTVFNLIYNIGSGILRAIGDSRRPLYFLITSCLTNILLDLLFVGVFGWGVMGVALATILSQSVSAVLVILILMRSDDCYRLVPKQIRFHGPTLKRIIRLGIPAGLSSSMYAISNTLIQATVNSFGTRTMAAWTAFGKLDGLFWMMLGAFGTTTATFCGQNFGARKFGRMRRTVRAGMLMSLIVGLAMSLFYQITQDWALHLFLSEADTLAIALRVLMIMTPFYFTFIPIEIFSGTCRSTGEALYPMLCSASGICGFRILWLLIVMPQFSNIEALSWSYPASWAMTSIIYSIYYFRKKWLTRHLLPDENPKEVLAAYQKMEM